MLLEYSNLDKFFLIFYYKSQEITDNFIRLRYEDFSNDTI